jgi:hypothetical protein
MPRLFAPENEQGFPHFFSEGGWSVVVKEKACFIRPVGSYNSVDKASG